MAGRLEHVVVAEKERGAVEVFLPPIPCTQRKVTPLLSFKLKSISAPIPALQSLAASIPGKTRSNPVGSVSSVTFH